MTTDNPAAALETTFAPGVATVWLNRPDAVSYTHLRAHET